RVDPAAQTPCPRQGPATQVPLLQLSVSNPQSPQPNVCVLPFLHRQVPPLQTLQVFPSALHVCEAPTQAPLPHDSSQVGWSQACVEPGVQVGGGGDGQVPPLQTLQPFPCELQV